MAEPAFDTLEAVRRLEAADIQADKADAIVEVVNQSTRQFVTVERFDAAIDRLDTAIDRLDTAIAGLHTRIDSVRAELREEIARSNLRTVIAVIAANALMLTVLGLVLSRGAPITPPFGAP